MASVGKSELDITKRASNQPHDTISLSADDKAQLAKMVVQDREPLQVLKNTIIIYNFFSTEIHSEEEKKSESESDETRLKRAIIEAELKQFYECGKMLEHLTLLNDVLSILASSG